MSGAGKKSPWRWVAAHPWFTVGAILYLASLGGVLATMGFDEADAVRQFVAQVATQPPSEPMPELPIMRHIQWPEITMQRDPFRPIAPTQVPHKPKTSVTPEAKEH
jgi:hypothetical protein